MPPTIHIDADGCPVKNEVYRVAGRYGLNVKVVANQRIAVPRSERIESVVVGGDPDEADRWIADHVRPDDIVVTADIPLAARCLERLAVVVGPKGGEFTPGSIHEALAMRELSGYLRDLGHATGGPAPFCPKDRSRFLSKLDEVVNRVRRAGSG